ncbi:MAG: sensor domain-containing protein [Acidimicrobiales bacterium]
MMGSDATTSGLRLQLRLRGKEKAIVISDARLDQMREIARTVVREPFERRAWSELVFCVVTTLLTAACAAFLAFTMASGIFLAITFVGFIILAGALRGARGIGTLHRRLARRFLDEDIEDPAPFRPRPGFFGWMQGGLRDPVAWRAVGYSIIKTPLVVLGVWFAFSVWWDAFFCFTYPLWFANSTTPHVFGVVVNAFQPGFLSVGTSGYMHGLFIFVTGILLLFLAPWPMRAVVTVDRHLMRALLGPDAVSARVRSLEQSRAQSVDSSAAT